MARNKLIGARPVISHVMLDAHALDPSHPLKDQRSISRSSEDPQSARVIIMEHTTPGNNRSTTEAYPLKRDRMALLEEIVAFMREHEDILARYHTCTMADLNRIEEECWRLYNEACGRGACGSARELLELEYLIGRAKEMRAKRMGEE